MVFRHPKHPASYVLGCSRQLGGDERVYMYVRVSVAGPVVIGVGAQVRRRVPRDWQEAARGRQQCRRGAQLQGRQATVHHRRI